MRHTYGYRRAAAVLLLCGLVSGLCADAGGASAQETDMRAADPADLSLAAAPEQTKMLFQMLLTQVTAMRGEVDSLKAGKLRSHERLAVREEAGGGQV